MAGSVATLVIRWRRARGDERQQLRWFIAGVVLLPVPLALHQTLPVASDAMLAVLFATVSATLGVAILRYRLYDLDVVAAQLAVRGRVSTEVHLLAVVVVAAAFHPLRQRVQRTVDRRFYGDRSRPYEAVAARLRISDKTVRNHVSNIFAKLSVADRAQAIVRAREAGLGSRSRQARD
jgi:two-component system NarL family sensor kinase